MLRQAWLEEQAALYQVLCEEPIKPSPVEFAARAALPDGAGRLGYDLRAQLIRRLRVLDGLTHALGSQPGRSEEDFQAGDVIQDLEILDPIARGGMSRVFRARQKSLGRMVALKTPHWAASLDPREKARFWREAQAIARLRHPGIVPIFAVGQRGGTPYLVLELVEGRPLSEVIKLLRRGEIPATGASLGRAGSSYEAAAAGLAIDILSALQAAHEAGIVHRDVKPGNVMLESSGRVRVLDFGLAKLQLDESLTNSREFLGTLQFTAPEILENPRGASPTSDVYAVGVLLYELLSLELPFGNLAMQALMRRVLTDEPKSLHARCRVSRSLSAIVSKAMARSPAARYESAQAFAADLQAFVQGNVVSARPASAMARLPQLARKHATLLVAVLALALVVKVLIQGRELQAGMDPAVFRDTLERALLWDFAETPRSNGQPASDEGSGLALELLETMTQDDHLAIFPRARVHLAVVAAERGDEASAQRHLAELEAAGWEYEAMQWVRDRLASGTSGAEGSVVRPTSARTPDSAGSDVDRYYIVRGRALAQDGQFRIPAPTGLEKHPVYAAPVRFLAALRETEGAQGDRAGTIEALREVEALVPHHPVVEAALLRRSIDHVRAQALQGVELEEYLTPLARSASATAEIRPTYACFWAAYGELLRLLEDPPNARSAFERGLQIRPGDPRLLEGMAQAYLDELQRTPDGAAREQLLKGAIAMLVEAVRKEPVRPEILSRIAAVRQFPLSPEQASLLAELQERTGGLDSIQSPGSAR